MTGTPDKRGQDKRGDKRGQTIFGPKKGDCKGNGLRVPNLRTLKGCFDEATAANLKCHPVRRTGGHSASLNIQCDTTNETDPHHLLQKLPRVVR